MTLHCPCGQSTYEQIAAGVNQRNVSDYAYELHRCKGCGLVRTLPVPSAESYHHGDEATRARIENEAAYRRFAASILDDVRRFQPSGRLLDVGCNIGVLVEAAEAAGYEAWGVDLDPEAVAYGQARGRRLMLGQLADLALPEDGFDIIIVNHVLEHVEAVEPFLDQLQARLRPTGTLIVNVPNYGGLVPRLMKANWGALWPHQHVWQFTPATLRALIERATSLQCASVDTRHNLEPPSTRDLKGWAKQAVIAMSVLSAQADEIRMVFRRG